MQLLCPRLLKDHVSEFRDVGVAQTPKLMLMSYKATLSQVRCRGTVHRCGLPHPYQPRTVIA